MKATKLNILITFLLFQFAISEQKIPYSNTSNFITTNNDIKDHLQNKKNINMSHSFSFSTMIGGGFNQTTSIYSNKNNYKISDKLFFQSGIHLMQNKNNLNSFNNSKINLGYNFKLDYIINKNSIISVELANFNHSPLLYNPNLFYNAIK